MGPKDASTRAGCAEVLGGAWTVFASHRFTQSRQRLRAWRPWTAPAFVLRCSSLPMRSHAHGTSRSSVTTNDDITNCRCSTRAEMTLAVTTDIDTAPRRALRSSTGSGSRGRRRRVPAGVIAQARTLQRRHLGCDFTPPVDGESRRRGAGTVPGARVRLFPDALGPAAGTLRCRGGDPGTFVTVDRLRRRDSRRRRSG